MKKLVGVLVLVSAFTLMTGCEKKEKNDPTDNSKSYECIYEKNEEPEYARNERIVSVDGDGVITTYNVIENASYTDEELYKKTCEEKTTFEKEYEEKKYENTMYAKSCSDDNLTISSNQFFDYQNLTDEEKQEMKEVVKYTSDKGVFDSKAWIKEMKKDGYTCQ